MNNALFITALFAFFQLLACASVRRQVAAIGERDFTPITLLVIPVLALLILLPFAITTPTWLTLNQPIVLAAHILFVLLALGLPLFIPEKTREAWFGRRTWWIWFGLLLLPCGTFVFFQREHDGAPVVGTFVLLAGAFFIWRGYRIATWKPHYHATAADPDYLKKWGDS